MHSRSFKAVVVILILCLSMFACKGGETNQDPNLENAAANQENQAANDAEEQENLTEDIEEPTEEPTEEPVQESSVEEINLVEFVSNDGVFYILYPEGWATNQVPVENGLSFGIVPLAEHFSAGPNLFNDPVIMVYGSVEQVAPELAVVENLEDFHVSTFYGSSSPFSYSLVGEPVVSSPTPYITYYLTQATSTLPTGVLTHWLLGTALADQTVVSFAVGVPDHSMELYGGLAQEMFNSIEIDTMVTAEMAQ